MKTQGQDSDVVGLAGAVVRVAQDTGRFPKYVPLYLDMIEKQLTYDALKIIGFDQALAGALIHDPKLLMLDEPLTGLDAAIARQVKDLLVERVRAGATIILTTHILEVAERLADRIGIIQRGRLIAEGTLAELRARAGAASASLEDVFLDITGAMEQAA